MKRLIFTFFFTFFVQLILAQVNTSVLSSGTWFKFSVDATGIFKIDKNLLEQIGVSTNGLNPKKIHIYGNGGNLLPVLNSDFRYDDLQENSIFIQGENDGSFDASDFILFYAKGPHDWVVDTATSKANHRQNIFSDEAFYFITVNNEDGKRVQEKTPVTINSIREIAIFDDFIFQEKEELNILAAGTQWFYKPFFQCAR